MTRHRVQHRRRGRGLDGSRAATGEDITYLRVAFRGQLGRRHPQRPLDAGIVRTVWMTADEIRQCAPRHRSPLLLRCLDDFLAEARYPLSAIYTDPGVMRARPSVEVTP